MVNPALERTEVALRSTATIYQPHLPALWGYGAFSEMIELKILCNVVELLGYAQIDVGGNVHIGMYEVYGVVRESDVSPAERLHGSSKGSCPRVVRWEADGAMVDILGRLWHGHLGDEWKPFTTVSSDHKLG